MRWILPRLVAKGAGCYAAHRMIDARMRRGLRAAAFAVALATVSLAAQGTASEFEVVSIKPNSRPAGLMELLSEDAARVVVDRTGIANTVSFTLEFAPMRDVAIAGQPPAALTLQDAVKEQLGLELASRRERPTVN
jgi:hypothetical protein